MKKITGLMLGLSFLAGGIAVASAQEAGAVSPPKVLVLYREFLKPGKQGMSHQKTEKAFVQAASNAKWPQHYFAVNSVSGRPRSLFLYPYDSFDAWEKDQDASRTNTAMAAANDRAEIADGDLLSEADSTVLSYRPEQSLNADGSIAKFRYFEISLYQIRAGHRHEWDELVKMVKRAYEKVPDSHWATYEAAYGQQPNTTYVIFHALKSASEIDSFPDQDKAFMTAMGEDGMKRLGELESAAVESRQTNLFKFSPAMSYPPDAWVKEDPDFWKPKAMMPMMPKKAAEKSVQ
ncbi:MAG TPA: hypothetical protein VH079_16975 [Terriglobales bacterium]|jgi:hypothetical protein|nr:hypothetical protein [Terriglobales bacterium]